jgi:hypothetical protein
MSERGLETELNPESFSLSNSFIDSDCHRFDTRVIPHSWHLPPEKRGLVVDKVRYSHRHYGGKAAGTVSSQVPLC